MSKSVQRKKALLFDAKEERFSLQVEKSGQKLANTLFGNPAIHFSGPVALRHQIALVLPLSETHFFLGSDHRGYLTIRQKFLKPGSNKKSTHHYSEGGRFSY